MFGANVAGGSKKSSSCCGSLELEIVRRYERYHWALLIMCIIVGCVVPVECRGLYYCRRCNAHCVLNISLLLCCISCSLWSCVVGCEYMECMPIWYRFAGCGVVGQEHGGVVCGWCEIITCRWSLPKDQIKLTRATQAHGINIIELLKLLQMMRGPNKKVLRNRVDQVVEIVAFCWSCCILRYKKVATSNFIYYFDIQFIF